MLSYLDAFFAVAETLSFSKASQRLKISQPAVSRQIKCLEDELGQALFIRDKHQVALTTQGQAFRDKVLPSYQVLLSGIKETKLSKEHLSGTIRVGCLRESGPFVELAVDFQKKCPGVVFQFEFLDNFEIFTALHAGYLDFGITTRAAEISSMNSYHLYTQDSIMVTRFKNERELTDFSPDKGAPFVRFRFPTPLHRDKESFFGDFFRKYKRELRNIKPDVRFAVNSHRSMVEVIAENDYYAIMPHYFVRKFLQYNKLRRVGNYFLRKDIYLTQLNSPHIDKKCNLFKQFLLKESKKIHRI